MARQKVLKLIEDEPCVRTKIRIALKAAADLDIVAAPPTSLRAIGGMIKDQAAYRA